jgi:hypothetical protein
VGSEARTGTHGSNPAHGECKTKERIYPKRRGFRIALPLWVGNERRDCPSFGLNVYVRLVYVRLRDGIAGKGQKSTRANSILSGCISERQQAGMLQTVRFQRSVGGDSFS